MPLNLRIITGSTRPGRVGPIVSDWVHSLASTRDGFETQILDLVEFNLPLLDEPAHPAMQQYQHEHTRRWSGSVAAADAFIFVVPEYDFFPSAAVINAVQALYREWGRKPAGVVSYGGVSGGLRSSQVLRSLLSNVNAHALPQVVPIPFVSTLIQDGKLSANAQMVDGMNSLLEELEISAKALKVAR